ncbi:lytic transglycosylase [Pseudooceanicola lipolyticus]|uniref:Lytic transglycosylase n=1 Tax=Pseudooceanicola lipolyticus TaxID=2029104 RepID=A0A2M8J469_9RHOB|nr:lytic transglycosylase domain-containing protein [Pseudooceanicola lipolyticus]MCC0027243.1 lytic transglycosylase domain-containing protein [Brucellaceae bacterium]PJE37572.1 lytic transglycosylase [Pseudooceanicola lipolyticus]
MLRIPQRQSRSAAGHPHGARRILSFLLSGLLLCLVLPEPSLAQHAAPAGQTETTPYARQITAASQRFGIPEHWIRAVMSVESAGNPRAVSSAGAMGLMQIMPETWTGLRLRHRLGTDPFSPRDNVLAGTAYLREMFDRYGNIAAMLAAYNAGPARYDAYLESGRPLPAETRAYVATLVPLLGERATVLAASRPADWRDAGLFVGGAIAEIVQDDGSSTAPPPRAAHSPGIPREIFAPRSGGEDVP